MDTIPSLRHLKQELSILILFFQCIFIYKGNLVSRFHYAKRVVSGNLPFFLLLTPVEKSTLLQTIQIADQDLFSIKVY